MRRSLLLGYLVVLSLTVGCVATMPSRQIPAVSNDYEFDVESPRAAVFEALLSVAQSLNVSVDVLEKDSGFIQFRNSSLSPSQLDQFCVYPFVRAGTNDPFDTFLGWNGRSTAAGSGSVGGTVSISIVLTETSGGTHARLHSTWVASNRTETNQVSSRGVLERDFERSLRSKLGLAPKP